MKKILVIFMTACMLFTSCASQYKYTDDNGDEKTANPYGWADYKTNHDENVEYEVCVGNVILSFVFIETIIVPICLTGWELFEPVGVKNDNSSPSLLP